MVGTLPAKAGGAGSIPSQEEKILHGLRPKKSKHKTSNIVTNSIMTLKMVHIKKINKHHLSCRTVIRDKGNETYYLNWSLSIGVWVDSPKHNTKRTGTRSAVLTAFVTITTLTAESTQQILAEQMKCPDTQ